MDVCPEQQRLLVEEADVWLAYKAMESVLPSRILKVKYESYDMQRTRRKM
jgi:hypothetical protein